ncbi:hypothetical protein ACFWZV_26560 [[Kitasatospora] papulosa]|uniref:hypothetical protein n=1 Tax=[Kitasatospora] papulosa TaxID=1464011 RepID=UPI0036B75065
MDMQKASAVCPRSGEESRACFAQCSDADVGDHGSRGCLGRPGAAGEAFVGDRADAEHVPDAVKAERPL